MASKYSMATGARAMDAHRQNEDNVEFTPPRALDEDLQGDSGKAECAWERRDGKICITAVNGVSLDGGDDEEDEPAAEDEGAPEEATEGEQQ
jgi:hypothetical protein